MLTYQVHKRVFRIESGNLEFPNSVEIKFVFQPLQPFGMAPNDGKTAVRGVAASVIFDENSGKHTIESEAPLQPLGVTIEELPLRRLEARGNELHLFTNCESLEELNGVIETIYYLLPMILNVEFADPPFVERVTGKIGNTPFRWELAGLKMEFETTTQKIQEEKIVSSWNRLEITAQAINRRLVAALHYFHIACRLSRIGHSPSEFMSEIILNLSKVLEVLFPPTGDGKTRDAARRALTELGYSENEIERDFMPAMALRNQIDAGHVDLSLFTLEQLQTLHKYTESAEKAFRAMLRRLFSQIQSGKYSINPYSISSANKEQVEIIQRLVRYFGETESN